jgi:hypothetical protein
MGHQRFRGHAAVDRPLRRRRLHHTTFAGAAGVAWTTDHSDPQLAWNNVELLVAVFANDVQGAAAAGAVLVIDVDNDFIARQVRRQGAEIAIDRRSSPRFRCAPARCVCCLGDLFGRVALGLALCRILQHQPQLLEIQSLRTRAKAMSQQTLNHPQQLLVLR